MAKKPKKNRQKPPFLARVARWLVRLLGPMWDDPAQILHGEWARVLLLTGYANFVGPVRGTQEQWAKNG